jgi:RNase P/RNase MRP subunit p30
MIDIVIPNNNEQEFIDIAERLGYRSLLFLYNEHETKIIETSNLKIYSGILADTRNVFKIKDKSFIAVRSSQKNRDIIEKSKANLLFGLEEYSKKDFMHQRGSGLDHVMSKLAHDKKVRIAFSLGLIFNSENKHTILGRMMQNIRLCRKYKVKTSIASFARSPYEMKSPKDIGILFRILGMAENEVKDSLTWAVNSEASGNY